MKSALLQSFPSIQQLRSTCHAASISEAPLLPATHHRPQQLIGLAELTALTRFSRSKVYLLLNKNSPYFDATFPRPAKFGRSTRWNLAQVEAWLAAKFEQRDGGVK